MPKLKAGLSILLATRLLAQVPTIKTNVPLVVIPVSVTDSRGHFVYDLAPADFTVLDNGTPRAVRVDAPDSVIEPLLCAQICQTALAEPRPKEAVAPGFVPPPCPEGNDIDPADWARAFQHRQLVTTKIVETEPEA